MDYNDAGAFARMAQGQKYISDAKQNIRKTDGQIKHWNNTDAIGYGRLGEYKRHNLSTEEIQRSKSGSSAGGGKKGGGGVLQPEINDQFNIKKYSKNAKDLMNEEL